MQSTGQFDKLSGPELALVLQSVSPAEVVLMCLQNKDMSRICSRSGFWETILRFHYPRKARYAARMGDRRSSRDLYFAATSVRFLVKYKWEAPQGTYASRQHIDYVGEVQNEYAQALYVVPHDMSSTDAVEYFEPSAIVEIVATHLDRRSVWLSMSQGYNGETITAFDTKRNAVDDAVHEVSEEIQNRLENEDIEVLDIIRRELNSQGVIKLDNFGFYPGSTDTLYVFRVRLLLQTDPAFR